MKNASLILNGVLLVAVVVLYVLHFSSGKPSGSSSSNSITPADLKIAYVNQDTLLKYYEFVKVGRDKLEAQAKSYQADLAARERKLQADVQSYRDGASNLTIRQAQVLEESLQKQGQNFQMYQQTLAQQMDQEQARIGDEFYDKLTKYLKGYSKERGIAVVIKYDRGSDVLFAGDSLDISKDVVKGLNEAWKVEKDAPAKKDSTGAKGK